MSLSFAKKSLITLTLGVSLLGGVAAANAATISGGGGTWDYGTTYLTMKTWPKYHHPSRAHGSTACNAKLMQCKPDCSWGCLVRCIHPSNLGWKHCILALKS
ncbi:lactococcin 972 family bacteriocin [Rothia sp. ZJ1223]|uniref:lactococcin 972 family bacteriocin n=1 Tax=Rothia sp. ZJ1223 TaxID=2811098 RepID=UPI001957EC58|nr:hypothetical protein [Rothia sp. ZJ1223]